MDERLALRPFALIRLPHVRDPDPFRKKERPLPELQPFFGRRIRRVDPKGRIGEVDVEDVVGLLPDRFIAQFAGGADEAARHGLEVIAEKGILDARHGDQEHHPDQQYHHGKFDQRVTPVIHYPSC